MWKRYPIYMMFGTIDILNDFYKVDSPNDWVESGKGSKIAWIRPYGLEKIYDVIYVLNEL